MISRIYILFLLMSFSFAQNFTTKPFVTVAGNNTNCVLSETDNPWPDTNIYLCWQNVNNYIYTIYLQKVSPEIGEVLSVVSDSIPLINPDICFSAYDDTLRISWQMLIDSTWQVAYRTFQEENFGPIQLVTEGTSDNILPKLSSNQIAWIRDSTIIIQAFSVPLQKIRITSEKISNFDIDSWSEIFRFTLLYEAGEDSAKQIYEASYYKFSPQDTLSINKVSTFRHNINPVYDGFVRTFQIIDQENWGIALNWPYFVEGKNLENPHRYSYPVITEKSKLQDFESISFVVYDCENEGQRDIYLYDEWPGDAINISQSSSKDEHAIAGILNYSVNFWDSLKVAVFWEHTESDKTDIWWATDRFIPPTALETISKSKMNFTLAQNYPNPFNPETTINYELRISGRVNLTIYDIGGRKIKTLINQSQNAGKHSVTFKADNLASGIYYYRLKAGDLDQVKKMVLLR